MNEKEENIELTNPLITQILSWRFKRLMNLVQKYGKLKTTKYKNMTGNGIYTELYRINDTILTLKIPSGSLYPSIKIQFNWKI